MKNLIAAAVLVIFNIMSIHAQNRIYGTVTDRNGEPLAGVNVQVKGTGNGTVSDKDGKYSLVLKEASGGNTEIVFSFIGMEHKTVRAKVSDGGETRIDAVLEESFDEIAGVEVVGIGERKEIRDVKQQGVPVSVIDGRMLSGRGTSLSEVLNDARRQEAYISYDIDEYDERFLRHLALGYTKEMIASLKGMPFGVKSLEKRQNDLTSRLFSDDERAAGVNATRLVVRAIELRILDIDNLEPDEE